MILIYTKCFRIKTLIFIFRTCQKICKYFKIANKCCKGFWGKTCDTCPGGIGNVCSGKGDCDDGSLGNGKPFEYLDKKSFINYFKRNYLRKFSLH